MSVHIKGKRRKHACELAGLTTKPVINRDAAAIIMVNSNLQRENILPSERAKVYKRSLTLLNKIDTARPNYFSIPLDK